MDPFSDPAMVADYAKVTPQRVPGLLDLHRMAVVMISETAREDASVLVLGAGGGLELHSFATARPNWSFVGVDASQAMLDLAANIVKDAGSRVELLRGDINDAPDGPFDGATCLLTLHFLTQAERLHVLRGLRKRLRPGAPLIIAHHCRPKIGQAHDWLTRSATFAAGENADVTIAARSAMGMMQKLMLLSEKDEEMLMRKAGFTAPAMFYAGLSFRGWVAYAPEH